MHKTCRALLLRLRGCGDAAEELLHDDLSGDTRPFVGAMLGKSGLPSGATAHEMSHDDVLLVDPLEVSGLV